jgi:hypothetical protein
MNGPYNIWLTRSLIVELMLSNCGLHPRHSRDYWALNDALMEGYYP